MQVKHIAGEQSQVRFLRLGGGDTWTFIHSLFGDMENLGECLNWFGISWSIPNSLKLHFESWVEAKLSGKKKKYWMSVFFAVLWTVWRSRNKIIFEKQLVNETDLVAQVKFYGRYWSARYRLQVFLIIIFHQVLERRSRLITDTAVWQLGRVIKTIRRCYGDCVWNIY